MNPDSNCLFCKIIAGDIPSKKVFENDTVFAFEDIQPQAPTHVLVIPKIHVENIAHTTDGVVFSHVLCAVREIAQRAQLENYRVAINNGAGAGQSVFHLHAHLLSGRTFSWPPG